MRWTHSLHGVNENEDMKLKDTNYIKFLLQVCELHMESTRRHSDAQMLSVLVYGGTEASMIRLTNLNLRLL